MTETAGAWPVGQFNQGVDRRMLFGTVNRGGDGIQQSWRGALAWQRPALGGRPSHARVSVLK
jgi:hypothetical protein